MGKMTGHPIVRMRHEVLVPSLCCIWSSPLIEWANPNKTDGQKATNKCSTLCGAKDKNRMLHAVWRWRIAVAFIGIGCLIWANNLSYCPMSNKKWAHEYHHMHTCCFYVSKPDPIESHKSQPSQRNKWILAKSFHCVAHFITRTVFFFSNLKDNWVFEWTKDCGDLSSTDQWIFAYMCCCCHVKTGLYRGSWSNGLS